MNTHNPLFGDQVNKKKSFHKFLCLAAGLVAAHSASVQAADLTWDGFGSAYYGQALTKDLLPYGFTSTNPDFTDFSLIGVNLHGKMSDELSASAQLVGSGRADIASGSKYSLFAQWAYVEYKPFELTTFRGGRQRFPVFSASEYINMGYYLPYRFIPANVYLLAPYNSFDGASITQSVETPVGKATAEVFGGTPILDVALPASYSLTYQRLLGARVALEGDGWRVRAQASRSYSNLVITSPVAALSFKGNSNLYSVGYRFDKYNVVSWAEYVLSQSLDGSAVPGSASNYLSLAKGGYALIGYRIGDFMPRYTFSQATAALGVVGGKTTIHNIGVNYQPVKSAIVKVEYEMNIVPTAGGGYSVTQPLTATGAANTSVTTGHAISMGVDFIF